MTQALVRPTVAQTKITDYILNDTHPVGGAKAAYFRSLGFDPASWRTLAAALREHPERNPVDRQIGSPYGIKYLVRCKLLTPDRRNPCIVTVWMMRNESDVATLVTAYPSR